MWLSGLHIPESYLTALVQATCRKNGWPLDKSTLYTTVTQFQTADDVTETAHQGCFVTGLYLEGGAWDVKKAHLIRQAPKQLIQELPVLKIIPIEGHKLKLQVSAPRTQSATPLSLMLRLFHRWAQLFCTVTTGVVSTANHTFDEIITL